MCGICGLVWRADPEARTPLGERAVRAMMTAMAHRGPDGSGVAMRGRAVLGHVRLAVIDLDGGAQPMDGAGGKVWLSYNGEVYNYPALAADAAARGWEFRTHGDTEAVLANFAQNGPLFDEALNGMYAYALLDERNGADEVWLGTDPLGIKPLFLYHDTEVTLFASELRAIAAGLTALGKPVQPSRAAVMQFFQNGWVPAPLALIEGTIRLQPGERWRIARGAGPMLHSRRAVPAAAPVKHAERGEALRELMTAAVRRQLISDVPLGFFLSGGIDSSLCVALAASMGCDTRSFTVRFAGEGRGVVQADESTAARAAALRLGSQHHELTVDERTLAGSLDTVFAAMDQPLADPACLPLFHLARMAREHATVCIAGDGGDELFAGYPRHRLAGWQQGWGRLPGPLRNLGGIAAEMLPLAPSAGVAEWGRKAGVGFRLLSGGHYMEPLFAGAAPAAPWHGPVAYSADAMMHADFEGQLAGQMLAKTDSMTMAHGLECRVPLLDLELVAFAAGLPIAAKRSGAVGKLPLRSLLSEIMPGEITARPKRGFRVPLSSWFRGEMAERIRGSLLGPKAAAADFLGRERVGQVVNDHLNGRREGSLHIWALLAMESWLARSYGQGSAR